MGSENTAKKTADTAKKVRDATVGTPNTLNPLYQALAQKGGAGSILLGIIFVTIWSPVGVIIWKLFDYLGSAKEWSNIGLSGPILGVVLGVIIILSYGSIACILTMRILGNIIPTLKVEAESAVLLSKGLGARAGFVAGVPVSFPLNRLVAESRTKQIMNKLVEQARRVLETENVRSNIFTLNPDGKLTILEQYHVNMEGPMVGPDELKISILFGFLSTGTAFKYFRPVLSLKKDGEWPYSPTVNDPEVQAEAMKAHANLSWIVSMPIPHQVQPFRLASGVLNVDGLQPLGGQKQLQLLLADASTAAALIGLINRGSGFLNGEYAMPSDVPKDLEEQIKDYAVKPEDFDPASCPAPTKEFVQALSTIAGLEAFANMSPTEVAVYLQDQLRC